MKIIVETSNDLDQAISMLKGLKLPVTIEVSSDSTVSNVVIASEKDIVNVTAKWRYWGGWVGNHDHRLAGANCTNCGYLHPTVYDKNQLTSTCSGCGAKIVGYEVY